MRRKYFKNKKEAIQTCKERNTEERTSRYKVFKMSKGTRHHGEFAVCTELEWLNTY